MKFSIIAISVAIASAPTVTGCGASLSQIEQGVVSFTDLIITDLQAGKTDIQIVDDIETQLGASATVLQASNILVAILNEVLASGLLAASHPDLVKGASDMASQTAVDLAKKVAAAHPDKKVSFLDFLQLEVSR